MSDFELPAGAMWTIRCNRDVFERSAKEPAFRQVTTLGRIANSLRFNDGAAFGMHGEDSPRAMRQRSGAFLYTTGILFEGLEFAADIGRFHRHRASFQDGLGTLLSEPLTKHYRDGVLRRLRNQAVYHHDDEVYERGLSLIRADPLYFVTGSDKRSTSVYYNLADIAILRYALDSDAPTAEFFTALERVMINLLSISQRFVLGTDSLVYDFLHELGWETVRQGSGDGPA